MTNMMNPVEQVKKRVRRAAETILEELRVSEGVENVSVAVKETAKSITVTIKVADVDAVASDEADE